MGQQFMEQGCGLSVHGFSRGGGRAGPSTQRVRSKVYQPPLSPVNRITLKLETETENIRIS